MNILFRTYLAISTVLSTSTSLDANVSILLAVMGPTPLFFILG